MTSCFMNEEVGILLPLEFVFRICLASAYMSRDGLVVKVSPAIGTLAAGKQPRFLHVWLRISFTLRAALSKILLNYLKIWRYSGNMRA
jgi:hypothetical protein